MSFPSGGYVRDDFFDAGGWELVQAGNGHQRLVIDFPPDNTNYGACVWQSGSPGTQGAMVASFIPVADGISRASYADDNYTVAGLFAGYVTTVQCVVADHESDEWPPDVTALRFAIGSSWGEEELSQFFYEVFRYTGGGGAGGGGSAPPPPPQFDNGVDGCQRPEWPYTPPYASAGGGDSLVMRTG